MGGGERVELKGQLYLLRTGQTQQHRFGIFFYGSPKRAALIWCGFVCVRAREYVCETYFCVRGIQNVGSLPKKSYILQILL